jgi:hypothetical protein
MCVCVCVCVCLCFKWYCEYFASEAGRNFLYTSVPKFAAALNFLIFYNIFIPRII